MAGPWEAYGGTTQAAAKPWERFSAPKTGKIQAGLRGFEETASFGLTDELRGFGRAVGRKIRGADTPWKETLGNAITEVRDEYSRAKTDQPGATLAGELVGAIAPAFTPAGGAIAARIGSGQLGARIVKGAATGAASGGAYGFGSAEGDAAERLPSAGKAAAWGAAIGGAAPAALVGLGKLNTKTIIPGSEEVRAKGGELFKKAEALGSNLPSEIADQFRMKVLSHLSLDGEAKLYSSNPVAERLTKNIQDFIGQPLSFNTAKQIDDALGDLAYDTMDNFGKLSSQGKRFLDLQVALRDSMDSVPDNEIVREARKYWSASLRMREIERIIEKAQSKEQPVTALKNGFSNLLNRGDKLKGYSAEEIKAIEHAAKTGVVTDVIKLAGSGLVPLASGAAGAIGGIPGSLAGYLAGTAVQQSAKAVGVARQMGRSNKALEEAAKRSGMVEKVDRLKLPKNLKEIMSLPPAQARPLLQRKKP